MRDLRLVTIEGRLVDAAEKKTFNNSEFVKFRLASSESEGKTLYVDCEWWEPHNAFKYLEKGKKVLIVGSLCFSEWTDKNDGKKRSKIFIKVQNLELRGSKKQDEDATQDVESEVSTASEAISDDFVESLIKS